MRLLNLISAVVAVSTAILMMGALFATESFPEALGAVLLQVVMVTGALAILVGIINLMNVHLDRIRLLEKGWYYSVIVILSALGVMTARALDIHASDDPSLALHQVLFDSVQRSLESALAGLIFFFLVYAAYRMMRNRVSLSGCLFQLVLLIVLVGWIPLSSLGFFSGLRDWLLEIPTTAGARGILIGIALGTITVGLRTLIGQEQAFREK